MSDLNHPLIDLAAVVPRPGEAENHGPGLGHLLEPAPPSSPRLRVHVIPVGFEYDRVVLPARERRADRVYLLAKPPPDKCARLVARAVEFFRAEMRLAEMDVRVEHAPVHGLEEMLVLLARLFHVERGRGNAVHVNLSSGSKMQAVAGMLACQMYGGHPYFCVPERYAFADVAPEDVEPTSSGLSELFDVPAYPVAWPTPKQVRFLQGLADAVTRCGTPVVAKKQCFPTFYALETDCTPPDAATRAAKGHRAETGTYNKLKVRYLDQLAARRWIQIEDPGVRLTRLGRKILEVYGPYHGLDERE